jgi:uncharacterized protein (TIGR01777 family)
MRLLVSGATGLIGRHFIRSLGSNPPSGAGAGCEFWGLSRRERPPGDGVARWFRWDSKAEPVPAGALEGVDVVVHLAGEAVTESRWTEERKRELLESRRMGTRHLVEGIAALPEGKRPRMLLSASAVGYYGDGGDQLLTEASPPGQGFLTDVCVNWEREAEQAEALGLRVVKMRIGVVLSKDGGALAQMLPPFRLGVGARVGSGKQFIPWIHIDDAVGMIRFALEHDAVSGPFNVVSPEPTTHGEFVKTLGHVLHRPVLGVVPAFAFKLAVGEMATAILEGQRALPEKAEKSGYSFQFRSLEPALRNLLG